MREQEEVGGRFGGSERTEEEVIGRQQRAYGILRRRAPCVRHKATPIIDPVRNIVVVCSGSTQLTTLQLDTANEISEI